MFLPRCLPDFCGEQYIRINTGKAGTVHVPCRKRELSFSDKVTVLRVCFISKVLHKLLPLLFLISLLICVTFDSKTKSKYFCLVITNWFWRFTVLLQKSLFGPGEQCFFVCVRNLTRKANASVLSGQIHFRDHNLVLKRNVFRLLCVCVFCHAKIQNTDQNKTRKH